MSEIRHMANCTNNNRRLARFYQLILGMEEVWNEEQNSPYAFYVTDGYFNLNCLQIHQTIAEVKRDVGINHFGFKVDSVKEIEKIADTKAEDNTYGAIAESWIKDVEGNRVDVSEHGWPV